MLIKCPECELQVSDKAHTCPHCGFPLKKDSSHSSSKKRKEHMRLPNGFGQISHIKNKNLRNPYRAMITVGKTETGKPICKALKPKAYFATYNEAYEALMEYNKNPYDLDLNMTMEQLYNKWSEEYFKNITTSSIRTVENAWNYCNIKSMDVKSVRTRHLKGSLDNAPTDNVKSRMKSVFNLMLDYALEYEIVDKNYARDFKVEKAEVQKGHKSFTSEEIAKLWDNTSIPFVNIILLQCYTGWRPQELCKIKRDDCDVDELWMKGGMKTDAGKNRVVPVCEKIKEVFIKLYWLSGTLNSEYLICKLDGSPYTYDKYYKEFVVQMALLKMKHSPHDPRKYFITLCKNCGMDEYAIKYIVGHSIDDITEKVYTERELDWFKEEIEKISET